MVEPNTRFIKDNFKWTEFKDTFLVDLKDISDTLYGLFQKFKTKRGNKCISAGNFRIPWTPHDLSRYFSATLRPFLWTSFTDVSPAVLLLPASVRLRVPRGQAAAAAAAAAGGGVCTCSSATQTWGRSSCPGACSSGACRSFTWRRSFLSTCKYQVSTMLAR